MTTTADIELVPKDFNFLLKWKVPLEYTQNHADFVTLAYLILYGHDKVANSPMIFKENFPLTLSAGKRKYLQIKLIVREESPWRTDRIQGCNNDPGYSFIEVRNTPVSEKLG